MNQNILLLITYTILAFNCYSMEQPSNNSDIAPVCYLALIPFETQNHIANFWYETPEEFIKRTVHTLKNIIINQRPIIPLFEYCQFLGIDINTIKRGLWSYSADKTKIAYLNNYYVQKTLTIIDLQKKKEDAILCDTTIDMQYPTEIALSHEATMIAAFEARRNYQDSDWGGVSQCISTWSEEHVLEIRKLATKKSLEIPFTSHYRCYLTAFNKQGTHILLYLTPDSGQNYKKMSLQMVSLKDKKINLDIPLKDKESVKAIMAEKKLNEKHTLQDCFISRGICKHIEAKKNQ